MKNIKTFEDFFNGKKATASITEEAEGKMYKQRIKDIASNAQKFLDMLGDEEDMEAWVQDKIVIADHNMEAIVGYYESQKDTDNTPVVNSPGLIVDKK